MNTLDELITLFSSPDFPGYKDLHRIARTSPSKYWNGLSKHFIWAKQPTKLRQRKKRGAETWFVNGRVDYFESIFKDRQKNAEALAIYRATGARKSYTYSELKETAKRLAEGLHQRGVRPGSLLLIYTRDKEIAALGVLACLFLGVRFGFIYAKFPLQMVNSLIHTSKADWILTDSTQTTSGLEINHKSIIRFNNKLLRHPSHSKSYAHPSDQSSFILFTSGTTATPKALLSGTAGCHIASLVCGSLFISNRAKRETHYNPLDFAWGATLILGFLGPLYLGFRIVLDCRPFKMNDLSFRNLLKRETIDSILLAPTLLELAKKPLPSGLKKVVIGGDLMSDLAWVHSRKFFNKKTRIINIYGSNECGSVMFCNFIRKKKDRNLMRPMPGVCFDVSKEKTLLIQNQYPSLTTGLFGDDYSKLWTFGSSHLRTLDIVDSHRGSADFKGRLGHLIKLKGRYVDLKYIENLLKNSIKVNQIQFVVSDSPKKELHLFYLGKPTLASFIRKLIKQSVGVYALPSKIISLRRFPTTASGKIDIRRLLSNENQS